jgi:predicted DNA-binding protein
MNQTQPKVKKVVNTLSVRLPPELYNRIAEIALERNDTLNSVFIEMVSAGLDKKASEQQVLQDFIFQYVPQEKLKELIHGRQDLSPTNS